LVIVECRTNYLWKKFAQPKCNRATISNELIVVGTWKLTPYSKLKKFRKLGNHKTVVVQFFLRVHEV